MRFKNSKGDVYYGMHFYPGVAQYQGDNGESFRVFLNEDTIRAMDPTFAGRPVFVKHVSPDAVDKSVDELRGEADGWVVESFFNAADGKHWCKFLVCSERGRRAIQQGCKLSNCYRAKDLGSGGEWNGVDYQKEVKSGEYEHLALVSDPRYEESIVLTPEAFKAYNDKKVQELKRLANNKDSKEPSVKFPKLFRRDVVENSKDLKLDELLVELPKSKREVPFMVLVNEADDAEEKKKGPMYANADHLVDMGNSTSMTVGDLVSKHAAVCNELEQLKAANSDDDTPPPSDDDAPTENDGDEPTENESDDEPVENENEAADDELDDAKKKRATNAKGTKPGATAADAAGKARADALRAANARAAAEPVVVDLAMDQLARGKNRYGSN